ncbi:MAG: hypothetical protein ABF633_07540 [Clostridium sp.]|uniref:hypothetical protein n=1 Tax=Clostridium sp. TaxID=1506 RepID=UPI0039E9A4D6
MVSLIYAGGIRQESGVYEVIDDCGGSLLGWMSQNPFVRLYREDVTPVVLKKSLIYIKNYGR